MSLLGLRQNSWRLIPGLVLACIMWVLWKGLLLNQEVDTQMHQQMPFPEFSLMDIRTKQAVGLDDLRGEVQIFHVWASWCGPCVQEHNEWIEIKNRWPVSLIGMIYRDDPQKALNVVEKKGDPYTYLINDQSGKLGLSLGIMGTPETFVMDTQGVIRYHHMGALTVADFEKNILPVIENIHREEA